MNDVPDDDSQQDDVPSNRESSQEVNEPGNQLEFRHQRRSERKRKKSVSTPNFDSIENESRNNGRLKPSLSTGVNYVPMVSLANMQKLSNGQVI